MNEVTIRKVTAIAVGEIAEGHASSYRTITIETESGAVEITIYAEDPDSLKFFL